MIALRPYQDDWVEGIYAAWGEGHRAVLGINPTGAGKTVCFSAIMHRHVGASAAVVHRKEIVSQISLALARMGITHRVVAPSATVSLIRRKHLAEFGKQFIDPHALCGVASAQTLTSKSTQNDRATMAWVNQVTLGVFDEGHHYVRQGVWGRAVDMLANARLLFVTATPERADGIGLGDAANNGGGYCQAVVEGPTTKWLIGTGFLCPFVYRAPRTDLDVRGLAVGKNGDFNATALRARVVESHVVGDVVRHYKRFAGGLRAIVFSTDVKTAHEQADEFRANGFTAEALSGETEQGGRDRVLASFERGDVQVLVNVDLFDEGFDVPAVECVILGRPTQSLSKYLQMIGRGLRTMEGKDLAVVIDPVRNWERHGMPTWPRVWRLESRDKRSGTKSDTVPQKVCKACTQPYEAYYVACPYCGHVPEPANRSGPEQVEGDLVELDLEAMDALFAKYHAANVKGEEYERTQIARGIPQIGRRQDAARHRATLHRRGVLENLVGWWLGMQPEGRSEREKQRRFFLRFGVDVVTAFTLNSKDTDALVATIGASFEKDMS